MQSQLIKSAERAYRLIESDLRKVELLIDEQLSSPSPAAKTVLEYIRSHRGKMLRPALVLLCGKCCGQVTPLHRQISAIVELIHIATLLHDDVIDESHQRRGRRTINSLYGNEAAVISGDFLFGRVFRMCAELSHPTAGKIIADTCIRVCQGELEQNFHRGNQQLSEVEYLSIITEKSASFLSSCCNLGAVAAGASPKQSTAFADFGLNIGIAFQIIDDVLDIIGNEQAMGKSTGSDFTMNTFTLPIIHLLATAAAKDRPAILEIISGTDQNKEAITALLRQYGSLDYACDGAARFRRLAVDALAGTEENSARTALIETADFCINRAG
ncbi:MAG: polyprenyl synthetase family protein [Sedimentisphaerales bacterium]|nr:polyprenyl synthetase family protein [Sedimentisphaerales bacterium]